MILGIDLGTCNTLAATLTRDGYPVIINDSYFKENATPSQLIIDDKMAIVGSMAVQYSDLYPNKNLIQYYKRNFGTQEPIFKDTNNNYWFSETIAAIILKKIKFDAELSLSETVDEVVITVPAHYNDLQRKSVIEAANLADINLIALLEEPVAAALSYMSTTSYDDEIIMVYDFGGGTFDLTLITKNNNQVHVLAKEGASSLGGKEFDEIIIKRIKEDYQHCFNQDISNDLYLLNKVRKIAENVKVQICTNEDGWVQKWISLSNNAFEFCFGIKELEQKSNEIIKNTERIVDRCLRSVGISFLDIHKIVMVGGTSQIPFIKSYWKNKINPESQELIYHDPFSSVALGAAIYAGRIGKNSGIKVPLELKTVSTYNIAILGNASSKDFDLLIFKNSPLPIQAQRFYTLKPNEKIDLKIVQYWDENDVFALGTLHIGPYLNDDDWRIELLIENRSNETMGVKVKNTANGKDLKFSFDKEQSKYVYNTEEQKKLLNTLTINTII